MSWHYLQGQEAASWEGSSLDGAPSALLKLIPTPAASCSQDRPMDALNRFPFGMTLRRSTGTDGEEVLTWFLGDSPVRTYRQQEKAQDSTASGLDCGPSLPGSLARCNPPSSGWKTRQCSLFGGLTEFSGTWPRWGTMRDGELFQQPIPALHTSENAAGFWPTPKKVLNMEPCGPRVIEAIRTGVSYRANGTMPEACLARIIWTLYHPERPKGKVNPVFVSWLMGWPISWTSLRPLATGKFRQWLRSHGASSPQDFQRLETRQA